MKGEPLPHLLSFLSLYLGIPCNRFIEASSSSSSPPPRLVYLPFLCPSSTPSQGQWLAIKLIFGTAKRKSINCEIKLKKKGKTETWTCEGGWISQACGVWNTGAGRKRDIHMVIVANRAHCDAALVRLPYGRSSWMNNAMISHSVFPVWLLATSGKVDTMQVYVRPNTPPL